MLTNEAKWIGGSLLSLPSDAASPCLNLGSSTKHYREVVQPFIKQYIVAPAEACGIRFIHADIKGAPGVDVVGDIYDAEFQAHLAALAPATVLCTNMLEQVSDPKKLADICKKLVRPGGHIIVSVPRSFPYHPDPIDTYFRPTPADIANLFSDCEIVKSEIVSERTYWQELSTLDIQKRLITILKLGIHLFAPFYKWDRWKERLHPLLWLFRRYRVSVVVLRRVD